MDSIWIFLLVLLLPLAWCILVFLVVGLFAFLHIMRSELLVYFRMQRRGRFLNWRQLSIRIKNEGPGTLIIEIPTLGFGYTHAWWTPEKVLAICPYVVPSREDYDQAVEKGQWLDWDRWLWDNYIDPEKGRRYLLRVWNGRDLEKQISGSYSSVNVVRSLTFARLNH